MNSESEIVKKFGDNLKRDVKLSSYSWFNLGGNAEYFYRAKGKKQLIDFLEVAKKTAYSKKIFDRQLKKCM